MPFLYMLIKLYDGICTIKVVQGFKERLAFLLPDCQNF